MNANEESNDAIAVGLQHVVEASLHWLELFDKAFGQAGVPFQQRPLKAAMLLVNDGILEISGGSKEKYWSQPWFAEIVIGITRWYKDRYGAAALASEKDYLGGVILLRGTPVRLDIPRIVNKVQIEGETAWMIYPDAIHESESTLTFFASKPKLESLSTADHTKLVATVATIVSRTRRINLALQAADNLTPEGQRLRDGVWVHVEQAVNNIAGLNSALASIGAWELHLAVEKAFKVFLLQHGNPDLKALGHDMAKLNTAAQVHGLNVDISALKKLPHWKKASSNRYSQDEMQLADVVAIYDVALQLMAEITEKLSRAAVLNNAGFLIKKPDWA